MLSRDLDLSQLDARHWAGWWDLLVPPRVLALPRWALLVLDSGAPLHLVIAGQGAVPTPARVDLHELAQLAAVLEVSAVIAIERTVLAALSREIESALSLEQDPVEQGLIALRAVKRHAGHGLWSEPSLLELLPAPGFEPLQRTFDRLVPDDSALVAYVLADDRSGIAASIIAVKAGGDITRVGTHRAIADRVDEQAFARAWGRDGGRATRQLLGAVEERFAKPSIALVLERAAWQRIATGPTDQLARELDAKRLVIDPAPAWLLGLLGGAAVAAVAGRAASALASLLPKRTRELATAVAGRARDAMMDAGAHPFALLGFDPLELWARLRVLYRDPSTPSRSR